MSKEKSIIARIKEAGCEWCFKEINTFWRGGAIRAKCLHCVFEVSRTRDEWESMLLDDENYT